MTTTAQKVRTTLSKFFTVFLLSSIAFTLGVGSFVYITVTSNPKATSVSSLNNNFGRNFGITEIEKTSSEAIPGLQSVTASFKVVEDPSMPVTKTMTYISEQFSRFRDKEIANVFVDATSADTKKTYKINFYGGTTEDFKDESFQHIINAANKIYTDEKTRSVIVESKPTLDGKRNTSISIGLLNENTDTLVMQTSWEKLISAMTTSLPMEGDMYSLAVTNNNGAGKNLKFSGFYYDDATLAATQKIDPTIWKTAETYLKGKSFNFLDVTDVNFTNASLLANSTMEIILAGDGAGANNQTLIDTFINTATVNPDTTYPNGYITHLRFDKQTDAIWTAYPL